MLPHPKGALLDSYLITEKATEKLNKAESYGQEVIWMDDWLVLMIWYYQSVPKNITHTITPPPPVWTVDTSQVGCMYLCYHLCKL